MTDSADADDIHTPRTLDRRRPRGFMVLARPDNEVVLLRASEVAGVAQHGQSGTTPNRPETLHVDGSVITMRSGLQVVVREPPGEVSALMNEEGEGRPPVTPPEPKTVSTLLGLPSERIDPGVTHWLTVRPQMVARIRSLLVDYATAEAFSLAGLRVGKWEVSAINAEPVPLSMMGVEVEGWPRAAEIGGEQEGGLDLWKDSRAYAAVQVMQDVSVLVLNTGDAPALFRGVLRVDVLCEPAAGQ